MTEAFRATLRHRAPAAKFVPFREVQFQDGAEPQANACHVNVERWVTENPQHKAVRGWLVTSGFLLDRHSVIVDEHGELFDITPIALPYRPPFLSGSEAEFNASPAQINLVT
jgi:hypothetical protein